MIRSFILKLIMYFVVIGLPVSFIAFLVLGCVWLGKQIFAG